MLNPIETLVLSLNHESTFSDMEFLRQNMKKGKDSEKLELSHIADGNKTWLAYSGRQFGGFL